MNNYTTAVIFDRKKKANKDTEGLLEIRISANRKSYYISTGVRVLPKQWAGTVLHRADAETLNDRLGSMVRKVSEQVTRCMADGREIDVTAIKDQLFEVKNPMTSISTTSMTMTWMTRSVMRSLTTTRKTLRCKPVTATRTTRRVAPNLSKTY